MASFDIVNKLDMQEVDNAVNTTRRTVDSRYDFRGSETEITLDKKTGAIHILTEDTMKLSAIEEMLSANLAKRKVSPKAQQLGEIEATGKNKVKRDIRLRQGIDQDTARKIVKLIKGLKLKVQAQIQDDQVRVNGKKIDDLQAVIAMLRKQELEVPLQFVNMKN